MRENIHRLNIFWVWTAAGVLSTLNSCQRLTAWPHFLYVDHNVWPYCCRMCFPHFPPTVFRMKSCCWLMSVRRLRARRQVALQSCRRNAANWRTLLRKWWWELIHHQTVFSQTGSHDSVFQIALVTKMERLMTSQTGVEDLEEFQFGTDGRKFPLFHSWNTKRFGESTVL